MADKATPYLPSTRHPWPCSLFLLPLLLAYEGGVLWLGGKQPETLRNGADSWVRWALNAVGLRHFAIAPLCVVVLFLLICLVRRRDRPKDLLGVTAGMAIESVIFALGLWGISKAVLPLLDKFGGQLQLGPEHVQLLGQIITFVGAGIYEEVLFRLLLFSGLAWGMRWLGVPNLVSVLVAATISAAVFSAAHHVGPFGEPFNQYVFAFRMMAGVYFAFLFQLRGFGVAVGAHAVYDILVGVSMG